MADNMDTDNFDYDEIDFDKHKRGKSKGTPKRWSFFVIEGIIVLVAMVAGGRFLFSDNADVSNLQATIDAQPTVVNLQATIDAQPTPAPSISADELFERAMDEIENGSTDAAIQSLSYAIDINPEFAEAYFERGELNYAKSLYYSASQDYESALEYSYSDVIDATYKLGKANYHWEDFYAATRAFTDALELDPDYADAYYWRGRSQDGLDNYENAIADILQALDLGYDEPEYAYFFLAEAYDDNGDYELAIENYTTSLKYSSEDCEAYYCWIDYNNRATSYYRLGDYETAVEDYTQAIQVNPDEYPLALKNRGDAYKNLGEMDLALGDWNTMFQLIDGHIEVFTMSAERPILREELPYTDAQAYVEFEGAVGDVVTIDLTIPDDSSLDAMLLLRDPNGSPMAYSALVDGEQSINLSEVVLVEDGTYTIVVASNLSRSSGKFTLSLTQ